MFHFPVPRRPMLLGALAAGVAVAVLPKLAAADTVAYYVPSTTVLNDNEQYVSYPGQYYTGSLGMDFNVTTPIQITALGAFAYFGTIQNPSGLVVTIYTCPPNDGVGTPVAGLSETITNSDSSILAGTDSRFEQLSSPITLGPGQYTVVANGYGVAGNNAQYPYGDPDGNAGYIDPPYNTTQTKYWYTNSGNGAIDFVGGARYGSAGLYPTSIDGGPPDRYAAGTFEFVPTPSALSGSLALLVLASAAHYLRKRRVA
jgi:hypothetical protein